MKNDNERFGPLFKISTRQGTFAIRAENLGVRSKVAYIPLYDDDVTVPARFAAMCVENDIVPPIACQSDAAFRQMIEPLLEKMTEVMIEVDDDDGLARVRRQALENIPANGKVFSRIYAREVAAE